MKIISNNKYKYLNNTIKEYSRNLEEQKTKFLLDNQELELKIEDIYNMLLEIKDTQNKKMGKEKLIKRIDNIIYYIEKGKIK